MAHTAKLLYGDSPLIVLPTLAKLLRDKLKTRASDGAIFLQQLHYWISKGQGKLIGGVRWIHNTYDQWRQQLSWLTDWGFRKIVSGLRELGLIEFKQLGDYGRDRTGYYTINYSHEWLLDLSTKTSDGVESSTPTPSGDIPPAPIEECPLNTESSTESFKNTAETKAAAFQEETVKEVEQDSGLADSDIPDFDQEETPDGEADNPQQDHSSLACEKREILAQIRDAGIPLSAELQRLIFKTSMDVIVDALAAFNERREKTEIKNPAGYLTRAIQGQWKPTRKNEANSPTTNSIPAETNPPTPEQMRQLEEAQRQGRIRDVYYSSTDGITKVVMPDMRSQLPWWEFLKLQSFG